MSISSRFGVNASRTLSDMGFEFVDAKSNYEVDSVSVGFSDVTRGFGIQPKSMESDRPLAVPGLTG